MWVSHHRGFGKKADGLFIAFILKKKYYRCPIKIKNIIYRKTLKKPTNHLHYRTWEHFGITCSITTGYPIGKECLYGNLCWCCHCGQQSVWHWQAITLFQEKKKRKMERMSNIKGSLMCILPSRVSSILYHTVAVIISNTVSVNCRLLAFLQTANIYW